MTGVAIDPGIGRRSFCLSLGAGLTILAIPGSAGAVDLKKVPMSTGIDAVFVPYVVAADRKIFEKYGLETSFKPFDDGNIALDAILTGNSDIGATTELGGLSRWDKGGKLYVTSYSSTSGKQIGLAGRDHCDPLGNRPGDPGGLEVRNAGSATELGNHALTKVDRIPDRIALVLDERHWERVSRDRDSDLLRRLELADGIRGGCAGRGCLRERV
jgi:hypothetical protein